MPILLPLSLFGEGSSGSGGSGGGPSVPPDVPGTPIDTLGETAWINNWPVEAWGMRLLRPLNWLSSSATPAAAAVMAPGMTAGQYEGLQPAAPLELSLEGVFPESDIPTRVGIANTVVDGLRGLLEIRFADAPTHVLFGVAHPMVVTPLTEKTFFPGKRTAAVKVSIAITCADGARYSRHARQLGLSTTPRAIPTGTLPSGGEILLFGAYTGDVDIDCYAPSGQRLYRLALAGLDLAAGAHCRVRFDLPRAIVTVSPTRTQTNALILRDVARSDRWWMVPSSVGDRTRASYCSLVLSAGTGVFRYVQGWEH